MGGQQHAALLDAETLSGLAQRVLIRAHINEFALVAAIAIANEIGRRMHDVACNAGDADVGDQAAGARARKFRVAIGIHHADDALANALAIVRNDVERTAMATLQIVVGRDEIGRVVGQQRFPFLQAPFIEQRRLVKEEIFDFRPRNSYICNSRTHARVHACAPVIILSQ